MSKATPELVELFCAKAAVVGATVHEAASLDDALQYVVDVCAKKNPCQLLADEPGVEKGPLGEYGMPTRVQRIVAAPGIDDTMFQALSKRCEAQGFLCIKQGMRRHLAGIDVGLGVALRGVAASGTCMVNSDSEEARLATMMCEICILMLRKSDIRPDLGAIAADLRALQSTGNPAYTAFITGPSRTADIERVPAVGVHGPLEQHIILLED